MSSRRMEVENHKISFLDVLFIYIYIYIFYHNHAPRSQVMASMMKLEYDDFSGRIREETYGNGNLEQL